MQTQTKRGNRGREQEVESAPSKKRDQEVDQLLDESEDLMNEIDDLLDEHDEFVEEVIEDFTEDLLEMMFESSVSPCGCLGGRE